MARRRKKHRRSSVANRPRRHHRNRRSRRYHRNPAGHAAQMAMAIAAGLIGWAAAQAAGKFVSSKLPAAVPKPELVSAALSSLALAFGASYLPVSADVKLAAQVGAWIPSGAAVANAVGLGKMLGTAPIIMLPAPGAPGSNPALPAPLSAQLNAALEAALEAGERDVYSAEY